MALAVVVTLAGSCFWALVLGYDLDLSLALTLALMPWLLRWWAAVDWHDWVGRRCLGVRAAVL